MMTLKNRLIQLVGLFSFSLLYGVLEWIVWINSALLFKFPSILETSLLRSAVGVIILLISLPIAHSLLKNMIKQLQNAGFDEQLPAH
jgi:hypothetical protein